MAKVAQQELGGLFAEMDALNAAGKAADGAGDAQEARDLTRAAFDAFDPKDAQDGLAKAAMAFILGEDVKPLVPKAPAAEPWIQHVFESIARAWACWAADPSSPAPLEEVARLRREQKDREDVGSSRRAGAIQLIALYFWAAGVEALAKNNLDEARRFWKRAIDIGASWGTESHPAVLWTYAATFFP